MTHDFHPTTLREYDIRGVIGSTLSEADAYAVGRGFGTVVARAGGAVRHHVEDDAGGGDQEAERDPHRGARTAGRGRGRPR